MNQLFGDNNDDKFLYFQEGDKNGGFESMDTDSGVSLFIVRQDFLT